MRPPISKRLVANSTAARRAKRPAATRAAATPVVTAPAPQAASLPSAGSGVAGARMVIPTPVFRKLRVFGVDPDVAVRFETAFLNEVTLRVHWEDLAPGPRGEYINVVDVNEHRQLVHPPLDLDHPDLLAQDGVPASDGNPAFRQQMVYAVIMRTIQNFERALGRPVHWSPRVARNGTVEYRRALQVCPHYMKIENAFFDPEVGFCFGYFEAVETSPFPGTIVFTALSQDVIAHELTHAILMGMNIAFNPGTNPDILAFHEAFADLVPLFQHFWFTDVLRQQIAAVRGNLREPSALGAVALQFGRALGRPDGIRNAFGKTDDQGHWQPRQPNPKAYQEILEPHDRGDILVGAIFEAFNKVYESRVADLRRIATRGTGVLPQGTLHPDLIDRLTREASDAAEHVLQMCIRALDYLPPVEVTFGDYLRAIITADYDLSATPKDRSYRVALLDAFRSYGIFPRDVGTISVETLLWPEPEDDAAANLVGAFVAELTRERSYWSLPSDRQEQWELFETWKRRLYVHLRQRHGGRGARIGAIDFAKPFELVAFDLRERPRTANLGTREAQWVVKIVQPPGATRTQNARRSVAGCTLLVDADSGRVRYHIQRATTRKPAAGEQTDLLARAGRAKPVPPPAERQLRVFAFDPSLGVKLETAGINEVVLSVPWERDAAGTDLLTAGPVGEYLEVVDRDPASGCFYEPVDLNHPHLLAEGRADAVRKQSAVPPADGVRGGDAHHPAFRAALGRVALWSPRRQQVRDAAGASTWRDEEFVQRLRIYPHALREANAYYSPAKKAILFGYFPAPVADDRDSLALLTVFTCLSHDIIAHEVTHALLDGMHRRFNEPTQSRRAGLPRGLRRSGRAVPALLAARGAAPPDRRHARRPRQPEPARRAGAAVRPGDRQARRAAQRDRPGGREDRRVDLVEARPRRLPQAARAARARRDPGRGRLRRVPDDLQGQRRRPAAHRDRRHRRPAGRSPASGPGRTGWRTRPRGSRRGCCDMCIRALDYCPPVDITFGDYLRAMVTADFEHDPVDEEQRCVAFVGGVPPIRDRPRGGADALGRRAAVAADVGRARRRRGRRARVRPELGWAISRVEPERRAGASCSS